MGLETKEKGAGTEEKEMGPRRKRGRKQDGMGGNQEQRSEWAWRQRRKGQEQKRRKWDPGEKKGLEALWKGWEPGRKV